MSETKELVERLRAACVGHPHAKIKWPHRVLHEAADLIERLEQEKDEYKEAAERAAAQLAKSFGVEHLGWLEAYKARAEAAEAQVATLQAKLEKAAEERDEWLRFIARWAWDKTGPADERLSVIQYFPPVKAVRPEPLSTIRETTE